MELELEMGKGNKTSEIAAGDRTPSGVPVTFEEILKNYPNKEIGKAPSSKRKRKWFRNPLRKAV